MAPAFALGFVESTQIAIDTQNEVLHDINDQVDICQCRVRRLKQQAGPWLDPDSCKAWYHRPSLTHRAVRMTGPSAVMAKVFS